MDKKTQHKFQEKMGITYEQYFKNRFQSTVELARAFEHALGKDRTFKIIRKWAEKSR
jgi:hypothetical protein